MLDPIELYCFIIRPTLTYLNSGDSKAAGILVLGTGLVESNLSHVDQKTQDLFEPGPAFGLFQMERATHDDIWRNFLQYREDLRGKIMSLSGTYPERHLQLMSNIAYAAAMCRLKYARSPDGLPAYQDIQGMALYWKKVYNTPLGKGNPDHFMQYKSVLLQAGEV